MNVFFKEHSSVEKASVCVQLKVVWHPPATFGSVAHESDLSVSFQDCGKFTRETVRSLLRTGLSFDQRCLRLLQLRRSNNEAR